MDPEIKRDTARFARTQWYVDGYASHFFSTEEDARAAWLLARQVARNERNEIGAKMRDALDACT